jgi:hypothetical protein
MSHKINYDNGNMENDQSKRSFDLTDSLLTGLCSKSSRTGDVTASGKLGKAEKLEKSSMRDKPVSKKNMDKSSSNEEMMDASSISSTTENSSEITSEQISKRDSNDENSSNSRNSGNSNSTNNKRTTKDDDSCDISTTSDSTCSTISKTSTKTKSKNKSGESYSLTVLPNHADPFVYDRKTKTIRYNFDRCVSADAVVIFGGKDSNFTFDPKKSTFNVGSDHVSNSENSFINGYSNRIISDNGNCKNRNNAIIASSGSELSNSHNSALIGCSNVKLVGCSNTVAMGILATSDDQFPSNLKETVLFRNIHVAGSISVNNVQETDVYVAGDSQRDVFHQIMKGDGINIVYANPINGPVYIQLGIPKDMTFEANRTITIKDVTLEFATSSAHNVYVIVPPAPSPPQPEFPQTRIEHYDNEVLKVSSDTAAGYILNTSGGSVTYRYVAPLIPGALPTWVIQNQFIGNPRILPFPQADIPTRSKILRMRK